MFESVNWTKKASGDWEAITGSGSRLRVHNGGEEFIVTIIGKIGDFWPRFLVTAPTELTAKAAAVMFYNRLKGNQP